MLKTAAPGQPTRVIATVHGEYLEPITVDTGDSPIELINARNASQTIPPIRQALEELQVEWTAPSDLAGWPKEIAAAARIEWQTMRDDLEAFLKNPIPEQELVWSLQMPEQSGVYRVKLSTGSTTIDLPISVGDGPPRPDKTNGDPDNLVSARVVYPPPSEAEKIFWQPLRLIGINWDFGWLGTYILAYLPAFLIAKRLLSVP
jgi:hypothetical protein